MVWERGSRVQGLVGALMLEEGFIAWRRCCSDGEQISWERISPKNVAIWHVFDGKFMFRVFNHI
jgi:hypothetical protein